MVVVWIGLALAITCCSSLTDISIVDADGELLRELVRDPTRDYQRSRPDVSDVSTHHTVELRGVEPLTS